MAELEKRIRDYAELVIRSGINIQKGQRLSITCPVECADFARLCAAAAYEAGCREVLMRWNDDELTRMRYLKASDDVFDVFDTWKADYLNSLSEEGAAFLTIYAEDPDLLSGVDPDRIKRAQISSGKATEKYRARMMSSDPKALKCTAVNSRRSARGPGIRWKTAALPFATMKMTAGITSHQSTAGIFSITRRTLPSSSRGSKSRPRGQTAA